MVIYYYNDKEAPIRQGDIFKNIPFFSFDFLIHAGNINGDETEKIIDELTENGRPILIETYLDTTLCILASQDCDIENNYDLIFFLLEEYKENEVQSYKQIDDKITQTTREFYLPKINLGNSKSIGPLKVKFLEPIKIPSLLIKKRLKNLRLASLKESIRQIFVSKLTFFLSRIGLEPTFFFENEQLQVKIIDIWKDDSISFTNKKLKIEEIKYLLKQISRDEDLSKIYFDQPIDVEYVKTLKSKLNNLKIREREDKLIELCEEIINIKNKNGIELKEQKQKFDLLLDQIYNKENCLHDFCNSEEGEKKFKAILKDKEENHIDSKRFKAAFEYFKKKSI